MSINDRCPTRHKLKFSKRNSKHTKASLRTGYRVPPGCAMGEGGGARGSRGWRAWSFFHAYLFYLYTYLSHHFLRHISNSFTWTPPKETSSVRRVVWRLPTPHGFLYSFASRLHPVGRATETLAHSGCSDVPQRVTGSARPSAWHTAGRRACRRACTK